MSLRPPVFFYYLVLSPPTQGGGCSALLGRKLLQGSLLPSRSPSLMVGLNYLLPVQLQCTQLEVEVGTRGGVYSLITIRCETRLAFRLPFQMH